ncbi:MAG: flagellar FliJ family protein [Phycisphaerales bacterium]|nr:flagellar FliJ family protein [Phycisphaerales bacterium]
MARFRFNLDPLLKHRQRLEREKQRALAVLERRRLEIEDHIRAMQQRIADNKSELSRSLIGSVDTSAIRSQAAMSMQLDAQTRRLVVVLAEVYRRIDRARVELLEARTRAKAIERLRDRRYQEWKQAISKREAAIVDDLTTVRAAWSTPS